MNNLHCATIQIPKTKAEFQNLGNESNLGIKIFKIFIPDYVHCITSLIENLDNEERLRAGRYHFEADRNKFIISRSFLKILLAKEIGLIASEVQIVKDSFDKPYLPTHPNLYFNISHSGDFILIIIGDKKVGIDIEKINYTQDYSDIIPTIFNKYEIDELLVSANKTLTFFKFWTRKEAIVKAIGSGITNDLKSIPVTDGAHLVSYEILSPKSQFAILSFDVDENHVGALAFEGIYKNSVERLYFSQLP